VNNNYKCLTGTELLGTEREVPVRYLVPRGGTDKILSPERVLGTEMDSRYR
jgi:hypothetical protein